MPIIARVVNHDHLHDRLVAEGLKPIYINDLPHTTELDKERIKELTITQLSSDTINIIPTCGGSCNKTRGRGALGKTCSFCGNTVKTPIDDSQNNVLWMRAPEGVDAMVSSVAWGMLSSYFTKNNHDAICWLTDSAYSPGSRRPAEIDKLEQRGHERDLNYFIRNFDVIVEDLMAIFPEKPAKPYRELRWWIHEFRDAIFTKFQCLPSKNMFITDRTILGIYMENSIKDALDTIYHFVSIDLEFYDRSPKVVANRTARVLARQAAFYNSYITTNYQPKPAHMRRQVMGSRNILSGRGVISSVTEEHRHDDVEIPWKIAVPMFAHAIMGKLMRKGMRFKDAIQYFYQHVAVYGELMHECLDEIFSEAKSGRGPVMILHRNC